MAPIRVHALPKTDATLFCLDLESIERRADDPNQYIARLLFQELDRQGRAVAELTHAIGVPLPLIGLFPQGSVWRDQKQISQARSKGQKAFRTNSAGFKWAGHAFQSHRNAAGRPVGVITDLVHLASGGGTLRAGNAASLFARHKEEMLLLSCYEVARFYIGAFSVLLSETITSFLAGNDLNGLFDLSRSRLRGRTVELVPSWRLRDRASALQLAMLVAEPDLRDLVVRFFQQVVRQIAMAGRTNFLLPMPYGAGEIGLITSGKHLLERPVEEIGVGTARLVQRLLADYRPAKFDSVVIDRGSLFLPETEESSRDWEEFEHLERVRVAGDADLRISSRGMAGRRKVTLPASWQAFRDSYPNYRSVDVSYTGDLKTFRSQRRFHLVKSPIGVCVVGASRAGGVLRRVIIGPDPTPAEPPNPTRRLFSGVLPSMPGRLVVNERALPSPLRQFVEAKSALRSYGYAIDFAGDVGSGHEELFLTGHDWGKFAHCRNGQLRAFAVCGIDLGGTCAYAIDFQRSKGQYIASIGIIAKRDNGRMLPEEVFRCVQATCAHISAFGSNTREAEGRNFGIWPSEAEYLDVKSLSLRHYARHRASAWCLADDLLERASVLAAV